MGPTIGVEKSNLGCGRCLLAVELKPIVNWGCPGRDIAICSDTALRRKGGSVKNESELVRTSVASILNRFPV